MTTPAADRVAANPHDASTPNRHQVWRLERSALLTAIAPLVADLGSTLAFYTIFSLTDDPRLAAAIGMALAVGQLVLARLRRTPITTLQAASIALVLAVGSLTLWTKDPRFVLVKATLVYGIVGGSMLKPGWLARYIPPIAAAHLPGRLLRQFEIAWAVLLLGTGALNLALVLAIRPESAARIMVIWAVASKLALFAAQYARGRAVARPAIKAAMGRGP